MNRYSDSTPNNDNFTDNFLVRTEDRAVNEVNEQPDQAFTLASCALPLVTFMVE